MRYPSVQHTHVSTAYVQVARLCLYSFLCWAKINKGTTQVRSVPQMLYSSGCPAEEFGYSYDTGAKAKSSSKQAEAAVRDASYMLLCGEGLPTPTHVLLARYNITHALELVRALKHAIAVLNLFWN